MQTTKSIICKQCYSSNTARSKRKGFFERAILLRLGLHPWKCLACKNRFFSRYRGPRKQASGASQQMGRASSDESSRVTQGIIVK